MLSGADVLKVLNRIYLTYFDNQEIVSTCYHIQICYNNKEVDENCKLEFRRLLALILEDLGFSSVINASIMEATFYTYK